MDTGNYLAFVVSSIVDCPYLNEAIHTPGWQKNEKTAAKVANALRKFKVKQQIDKQLANWRKEQEEKTSIMLK
jgi:hypothetical protein